MVQVAIAKKRCGFSFRKDLSAPGYMRDFGHRITGEMVRFLMILS